MNTSREERCWDGPLQSLQDSSRKHQRHNWRACSTYSPLHRRYVHTMLGHPARPCIPGSRIRRTKQSSAKVEVKQRPLYRHQQEYRPFMQLSELSKRTREYKTTDRVPCAPFKAFVRTFSTIVPDHQTYQGRPLHAGQAHLPHLLREY